MTIPLMWAGRTESSHSDQGPPYQCSFSEMRDQCTWTAYSLDHDDQEDTEHDVNSRLSCTLSGDDSDRLCATFKSLSIFGLDDDYFFANSRANTNGRRINPQSM